MQFKTGPIEGVIWRPLLKFKDARGWLCELFRHDEVPIDLHPTMAYVSETLPGVARGPHEHVDQADYFCFIGPSDFEVLLWDNRPQSPTYKSRCTEVVGQSRPMMVIIPPGVVHAYRNVGAGVGWVFNCPNRLYRGNGRKEPVDEIRHEADPASPFKIEAAG
jgi:dTDP-4-dehydrorhamnose 3,5-epimerase